VTGLLIAEHKTVSGIAREFADAPDQSCLNRFLTDTAHQVHGWWPHSMVRQDHAGLGASRLLYRRPRPGPGLGRTLHMTRATYGAGHWEAAPDMVLHIAQTSLLLVRPQEA
jgi:hypothetical protein